MITIGLTSKSSVTVTPFVNAGKIIYSTNCRWELYYDYSRNASWAVNTIFTFLLVMADNKQLDIEIENNPYYFSLHLRCESTGL
jgi:hypothetical protein